MHHNSIKILFLAAILQSSCQANLPVAEVPDKKIPVSLSISTSNASLAHSISEAIYSVHILVFKANTSELGQAPLAYTVKATLREDNKFNAILSPSNGEDDLYRFVILANADNTKIARLSGGSTYNQVSETLHEDARQRYTADTPIPMFGVVKKGEGIQVKDGMSLGDISLIRSVARIDIGVGTYNGETGKWDLKSSGKYFELADVEVWSPMNRNFDMPAGGNFSYEVNGTPLADNATGGLEHSATTAVQWKYTKGTGDILANGIATYCKNTIYLPETPLKGYTANQPENRDKRTTLIIGGYLHDPAHSAESGTKTWYRVDFTTAAGDTPDGPLFDILRNHLYRISLNVQRRGAATAEKAWKIPLSPGQITVEITPWIKGENIDFATDSSVKFDQQLSSLPNGVNISGSNRITVSNKGAKNIMLAFSSASALQLTDIRNPESKRFQINTVGDVESIGDKMVTRFSITVNQQTIGQLAYTVNFSIKTPFQELAYNQFTVDVEPADKLFPTVMLGGCTWMAFNTMGKGNNCQLYLEPQETVDAMYNQHWERTLGLQFQFGINKGYLPWQSPSGSGGLGPNWNDKQEGGPCPEGYRVPKLGELRALLPKGFSFSVGSSQTYSYNGELITASLNQGNPVSVTFPESSVTGDTYYVTLKSNKTGAVMYIPFGGWKTGENPGENPNNKKGVYLWANELSQAIGIIKNDYSSKWETQVNTYLEQNSYAYVRCIKK